MTGSDKTAVTLAGMIVAAIYVIMLIALTRSNYFIGGDALARAHRTPALSARGVTDVGELTRSIPPLRDRKPQCTPIEIKAEAPADCARAAQALYRLLERAPQASR